VSLETNNAMSAITDLDKAIEEKVNLPMSYFMRGFANSAMKRNDAAMADLNKAIELGPSNGGAYFMRGKVYIAMNNKTAGKADIMKAAELGDKDAMYYLKNAGQKRKSASGAGGNWVVWK
jgi:tetratricopeptide (TPR) repeat protein